MTANEALALAAVKREAAGIDFWNDKIADVMAFCEIESSFNPHAYRFEPRLREASYGVMQVLASTAEGRGFKPVGGDFSPLFTLQLGLHYGMSQVLWTYDFLAAHNALADDPMAIVAGAYNAGVGNALHGIFVQAYVDDFKKVRERWRSEPYLAASS